MSGLNPLPTNSIFLERMNEMTSLLMVLSPRLEVSICGVMSCLLPFLKSNPTLKLSTKVSWNVVLVVCKKSSLQLPLAVVKFLLPVTSVLVLLLVTESVPVHLVCQAFQRIGVQPVCGSNAPNSLVAACTASV